jgi:hypothetical protein
MSRFISFTRSRAVRFGLVVGTVSVSASIQAPVLAQSINATQLSVVVAPTKIVGTALGGEISFTGNGLTAGTAGTLDNTGAYSAGTAGAADANTSFNFDLTVRAADVAPIATALGTALVPATGTYGTQKGYWSNSAGTNGTLAISNINAATITAGANQGTTATSIFSSTMGGAVATTDVRRVATSSNDQATFDSTRQAARVQVGGSGLSALSNVTIAAAALGTTGAITVASNAAAQANVAFTKTEAVRTGQAGAVLTASTTDITNPAYGTTTATTGGISAGAITATNLNTLTVVSGDAGTAATLSLIQSMSVF